MATKPTSGRSRVSKASEVVNKMADEKLAGTSGRSRVSKVDDLSRKIPTQATSAKTPSSARVRPSSKVDEIERKIPVEPNVAKAPSSTRVRPSSKVDEIEHKIPTPSQSASAGPSRPSYIPSTGNKRSACCLLPLALGVAAVIGVLIYIF